MADSTNVMYFSVTTTFSLPPFFLHLTRQPLLPIFNSVVFACSLCLMLFCCCCCWPGSIIPRPCSQRERRDKKRLTFRFVSFVCCVQLNPRFLSLRVLLSRPTGSREGLGVKHRTVPCRLVVEIAEVSLKQVREGEFIMS